MKATYEEFREYLEEQVKDGSIYLWGGQGEGLSKLTDSYIAKKETSSANAKRVIKLRDARKGKYPNLKAYDCSGLGMYFLQNVKKAVSGDMTSNTMMGKCTAISKAKLEPGDFVFRVKNGKAYHIGYVVDDGYVIEAYGRDKGVIKRTLNAGGSTYWNAFGRSPWIESAAAKPVVSWTVSRILKKATPNMKGEDVKNLQKALKAAGMSPGTIDGIFGSNTGKAIKLFQKANALKADGIAGKDTVTALGGKWIEAASWTVSRLLKYASPMMKGTDVTNLQKALDREGYAVGRIDGTFGTRTRDAVKAFQKAKKLTADGIAGKDTVTKLGGKWKG